MGHCWEYEFVVLEHSAWGMTDQKKAKERFNQLGRLGWELVSVSVNPLMASPVAVFKRPTS